MASVSTSFTSVTAGNYIIVQHGDDFTYSLSGTFVATLQLEKSSSGGASWDVISSHTAAASGTIKNEDRGGADIIVRWNCVAYTSGTAVTSVADATITFDTVDDPHGNTIVSFKESGVDITGDLYVSGDIRGEDAAQGGDCDITGGDSSTSANAGGAVNITGGTPGATGVGGALTFAAAAGGSTSGAGGVAALHGGAGTAGNSAGGIGRVRGGAGQGSAAGGDAQLTGGAGGATGAGGAVTITSGAGGATSGVSGDLTVATGTTTAGSGSATGAVIVQSGAGAASAAAVAGGASGAVTVRSQAGGANTGGASGQAGGAAGNLTVSAGAGGATNSTGAHAGGAGGDIAVTAGNGGNATAGTGNGGAGGTITLTPGTGGTSSGGTAGVNGVIIERGVKLVRQGAPAAKTTSATLTAAEVLTGIITVNQGAAGASAQQLPLATAMDTALPDSAADDAFDFSVINISTVDAEDASVTTNTGWTLVGSMDIPANNGSSVTNNCSARFRARKTATGAWTLYRLA